MVAITFTFAPPLALLVFFAPAVLVRAAGVNDASSSCFASASIAFRNNGYRQTPPLSRWQQTASNPIVEVPTLELGSKLLASKRDSNDGRDEIDGNDALCKKRYSMRFRQRMRKVAKVMSLALFHFTALRLRPGSAVAAGSNADAPPVSQARPASVVRMLDDDRRVVPCSIKPGAIQAEDGTFVTPETGETGTLLHDFGSESDDVAADTTDANVSPKKLSRKERRTLRRQQRQKEKQWEEYGDEDEDDDEDFASGDGNLLSDGGAAAAAAAAAPGMGAPGTSQGGYMSRPLGATGMSDKAKSNIQAKVILIAGGGYAVSCFGYEGWQWNKEQKKVETSIEILGEQAKELGLKLEANATATDEEIADELRNITDTSEGEDDDVGNSDDEVDDDGEDDDDEPEPPRRRPRKPIRPGPGDDDDDDYGGGMGGSGDGRPSADDLNKLNNLFKKS